MRRVVITGMGAVTPVGLNVADFWDSVKAKRTGFGPITKFDTSDYKVKLAAELKDFHPEDFMDKKAARRMEAFSQYAVASGKGSPGRFRTFHGERRSLPDRRFRRLRHRKPSGCGAGIRKNSHQRAVQGQSPSGSFDDLQHGRRKCFHCIWIKRKKHQCGNSLCIGNPLHRRGIPHHSVCRC